MGLLLVPDLEPVLHRAQRAIGPLEPSRVVVVDVARPGEQAEGLERVARPDGLVVAAVHELQELHRELDVADAARTALQLAVAQPTPAHLTLGTRLHGPDLSHCVGVEHGWPHERLNPSEEAFSELAVAGDDPGFDQRLELPRLRPALVVREVRVEAAAERARPAFGAQVGVGAEHDAFCGRVRHQLSTSRAP